MALPTGKNGKKNVPLLGNAEKGELERLILARLTEHYAKNGPAALLEDGVRVIVSVDGKPVDSFFAMFCESYARAEGDRERRDVR